MEMCAELHLNFVTFPTRSRNGFLGIKNGDGVEGLLLRVGELDDGEVSIALLVPCISCVRGEVGVAGEADVSSMDN